MTRDAFGNPLVPGYNVDEVNITAGCAMASNIGYGSFEEQTVVEYALQRWARGEEEGAFATLKSGGIDLTSAYMIISAAVVGAQTNT